MKRDPVLTRPLAILLDMDGTLTCPLLDFDQIRRDMGIGSSPILEALKNMPESQRASAEKILLDHEDRAARNSTLNPGCVDLLKWIDDAGIKRAVVTRNTPQSVQTVFDLHGLHFDVCVTRADGKYKPDPAPLLLACKRLGVDVADAWMVGDGYHDIEAGVAADMWTVWVHYGQEKTFAAVPSKSVRDLPELLTILKLTQGRIHPIL